MAVPTGRPQGPEPKGCLSTMAEHLAPWWEADPPPWLASVHTRVQCGSPTGPSVPTLTEQWDLRKNSQTHSHVFQLVRVPHSSLLELIS